IFKYSAIAKPLTNLTRKGVQFQWTDKCQDAFNSLKKSFTTAPILSHFQPDQQIIVETDSSDYAVAAILSQVNPEDSLIHPVAY
ncbi:ribonuclease H family protein, partial [Staphylococcus aureus]|uniref:ribonuclease H family protein n=1 Tax=Staphylococcus aureus TaxID=1280 RepID=UPI003D0A22F2